MHTKVSLPATMPGVCGNDALNRPSAVETNKIMKGLIMDALMMEYRQFCADDPWADYTFEEWYKFIFGGDDDDDDQE